MDQMDLFYGINDKVKNKSLYVNKQLEEIPPMCMSQSIHQFGLEPIKKYLDRSEITDATKDIKGFVRYFDRYLVEMSGGKRSELIRIGEKLTGTKSLKMFSMRLMRVHIISSCIFDLK